MRSVEDVSSETYLELFKKHEELFNAVVAYLEATDKVIDMVGKPGGVGRLHQQREAFELMESLVRG